MNNVAKREGIEARLVGKMETYQPLCSVKDRNALRCVIKLTYTPTMLLYTINEYVAYFSCKFCEDHASIFHFIDNDHKSLAGIRNDLDSHMSGSCPQND